jgi:hypothetical protein
MHIPGFPLYDVPEHSSLLNRMLASTRTSHVICYALGHNKIDIPIYTVHTCVCAWTCQDTYVLTLPVESPYLYTLVLRILTSHNCCVFLNLSWLVPVHQDENIWLADHSPLSGALCFFKWCRLLSCSATPVYK